MFGEAVVARAEEYSAVLASMDDEQVFGPVFHRLGFGEAVEADLLADYKVMVLVVTEEQMAGPLQQMMAEPDRLASVGRKELLAQAKRGEVIVLDVRPQQEYDTAHLPCARSLPLPELAQRLAELPRDVEIVAYCRGPFCLMSDEAVRLLTQRGFRARKTFDGVSEWRAAGLPLAKP